MAIFPRSNIPKEERRKYKRFDTIFPVEFQILGREFKPVSGWHQAFSQDISKSGMCFTINELSEGLSLNLEPHKSNLLLQIHSPVSSICFLAYANVVWVKKVKHHFFTQFLAGVNFSKVDTQQINKFLRYISFKKFIWRMLLILIIATLLTLFMVINSNIKLGEHNRLLIGRYSQLLNKDAQLSDGYKIILQGKEVLNKTLNDGKIEMEILKATLEKTENSKNQEIIALENKLSELKSIKIESEQQADSIEKLNEELDALKKSKEQDIKLLQDEINYLKEKEITLKNNLSEAVAKELEIKGDFSQAAEEKLVLDNELKERLYNWIKTHQNQRSGMVVSFEGDNNLKDTSYLYDQALSVIAYTLFDDYGNAKKILDFFLRKAKRIDKGCFYNAYYSSGGEVAEFTAHAGPNLWLGIAILQYTYKTKDDTYLGMAEQIYSWIKSLIDSEGGIIGGRNISWYSTEHNLDGLAFFNMFYELTKDNKYKESADKIFEWLKKYAYGNKEVPINRGKGDSTIATDTYAWSIAALGPNRLKQANMDPDAVLEFAIENCLVEDSFTDRLGKIINVSGFDFAKPQHIARGGVVSCEWTAQMILSFNIMSDYYSGSQLDKSMYYKNKSAKYLNELSKMIIASPSAFGQGSWCLPYASQENADTGHSWRTPQGSRTGSVAATAYTIFAISNFNPLELPDSNEKNKP